MYTKYLYIPTYMIPTKTMNFDICRICCINAGTTNIFDEVKGLYKKIVHCCAHINISEEDGLPTRICRSCESELSLAYQFVLKCEAADKNLRSLEPFVPILDVHNIKHEVNHEKDDPTDLKPELFNDVDHSPLGNQDEIESEKPIPPNIKKNQIPTRRYKSNDKLQCQYCGLQCRNRSNLVLHMRKHSEHRPYACTNCDKKYKDGGGLKRHIERNHNHGERKREFICEVCGKAFYTKTDIITHNRIHTGETPYACDACPRRFSQISSLLRHRILHTNERSHSCAKCTKKFQTKDILRQHQTVHSTEKKYTCTTCNVAFKYKNNLRKHLKLHFQSIGFICYYCNKVFKAKVNLRIHIERMHSEKSGICTVCSKNVSNLETHMWKHDGKKPYNCDLCSSNFNDKNSLSRHINFRHKHTDKYKCTVQGCTVSFPSQAMVEFHVAKFHGSGIPFPCVKCSKGFYRKSDLARHNQRSHREKLEL